MSQERLNGLSICCIDKDVLENIDLDTIINDFAFTEKPLLIIVGGLEVS